MKKIRVSLRSYRYSWYSGKILVVLTITVESLGIFSQGESKSALQQILSRFIHKVGLSGQKIPEIVRVVDTSIKGKLIFLAWDLSTTNVHLCTRWYYFISHGSHLANFCESSLTLQWKSINSEIFLVRPNFSGSQKLWKSATTSKTP